MGKIRVGVLRGGPSSEYKISLMTGENVLKFLPQEKFEPHDIFISKEGLWHMDGFPAAPGKILAKLDCAFNALHGEYGEDGEVQQILEAHSIPFTGSGIIPSALAMRKIDAKNIYERAGLKTPRSVLIKKSNNLIQRAREIREFLFPPWVVKPMSRGSSVGITIAKMFPELIAGLTKAFKYDNEVIAEEYIKGREATAGVVEHFRSEPYYAFPVVEIIPPGEFFDYEVKYNDRTHELCPANFPLEISRKIQEMAIAAHRALGLRHYSRSDFIVGSASPDGAVGASRKGIFILETNSLPGLTSESLLPKASEAIGLSFPNLLDHIVTLALAKK